MNEVNHRQMNYKTQSLQFGRKTLRRRVEKTLLDLYYKPILKVKILVLFKLFVIAIVLKYTK